MSALQHILSHTAIWKLGWVLVHSLWQLAAVAALLAIVLGLLGRASANARYLASCAALVLMVALPLMTPYMVETRGDGVTPAKVSDTPVTAPPPPTRGVPAVMPAVEVMGTAAAPGVTTEIPGASWSAFAVDGLETSLPYLVLAWLAGVFGLSLWHLGGWAQLQRLKRRMVAPVANELKDRTDALAERLRVCRAVALAQSALVQVPTVVGWLKPMILLPAGALTGLSTTQLEALLAHELAHIRRHDYLVNMLQTAIEILGYYHPAVWWVSRHIRVERENCCDDMATGITGDRVLYADALATMEELRGRPQFAMAANGGSLLARIRRLGRREGDSTYRTAWLPSLLALGMLAIVLLVGKGMLADAIAEEDGADQSESAAGDNPLGLEASTLRKLFMTGKTLRETAAECERFRDKHGRWPASIAQLYKDWPGEAGRDPFSDGPYHVTLHKGDASAIRIWSVGPDGDWDGGRAIDDSPQGLDGDIAIEVSAELELRWLADETMQFCLEGRRLAHYLASLQPPAAPPLFPDDDAKYAWGEIVDGLQAAMEFVPRQDSYAPGEALELQFRVRNASRHTLKVAGDTWRQDDMLTVTDEAGHSTKVGGCWYSGWSESKRETLRPGETAVFKASGLAFVKPGDADRPGHPVAKCVECEPGRYTLQFRLNFPDLHGTELDLPQPEDWQGTLVTGKHTVHVRAPEPVEEADGGVRLEFRLAEETPADGLTESTILGSDHRIWLYEEVPLSEEHVKDARVVEQNGQVAIELLFTNEGRRRFAVLTRNKISKRLAILVDGKVLSAPVIREEIRGGKAHISGSFSREEAERIVAGLNESTGNARSAEAEAGATAEGNTEEAILLTVEQDGSVLIDGLPATIAAIQELGTARGTAAEEPVLIRAHRETAYSNVVAVLNACKDAGFQNISFAIANGDASTGGKETVPLKLRVGEDGVKRVSVSLGQSTMDVVNRCNPAKFYCDDDPWVAYPATDGDIYVLYFTPAAPGGKPDPDRDALCGVALFPPEKPGDPNNRKPGVFLLPAGKRGQPCPRKYDQVKLLLRGAGGEKSGREEQDEPPETTNTSLMDDPRGRFLEIERIARLPKAEQGGHLERLYFELAPRYMNEFVTGILSSYPRHILDRAGTKHYDGNSERWAQELADATAELSPEEVADKLERRLWLNVAARARAMQVFNNHSNTVETLIEADLTSRGKARVARAAGTILTLQLHDFTDELLDLFLADEDASEPAYHTLLSMRDPDIVKPLLEEVEKNPNMLIRCAGLLQAPYYRKPAEPLLLKLLESPDKELRYGAVRAVYECRDARLAPHIVDLARNEEFRFRVAAAYMARKLPADAFKAVRQQLLPLLRDKDEAVQIEALQCFAQRKDFAAGPVILELLRRDQLGGGDKVGVIGSLSALTGDTFGYDMHNWGPAGRGNQKAIAEVEGWLRDTGVGPAPQPETLDAWVRTCLPGCTLRQDDEGKPIAVVSPRGETLALADAAKHIRTRGVIGYWSTHGTQFLSAQKLTVRSAEDAAEAISLLHVLSHGPEFVRRKIYKPHRIPTGWVVEIDHDLARSPGMIRHIEPYELLVDSEQRLVRLRQRCYTYHGSESVYTNTVVSVYEKEKNNRGDPDYPEVLREELRKAWEQEQGD
jgi:beta-lactamase regulating signal transducer with metallopeptidase domain/biopolymer transport protein ExbD